MREKRMFSKKNHFYANKLDISVEVGYSRKSEE